MNTLILGVGNLLLSDEAIGVRIVESLGREYRFAPGIELLDGGTAGMELMEAMASRDHLILVDAVRSGHAPGTVVTLNGDEIPTLFGRKISPHQLGL
ncbi:MAG: hydrogenase maturation protease, partial [Aeromonas sp.]